CYVPNSSQSLLIYSKDSLLDYTNLTNLDFLHFQLLQAALKPLFYFPKEKKQNQHTPLRLAARN
ncbi:hypothetical protein ABEP17_04035, partial [Priestia flexa]|uniref:hypothetical protein n=1 Tax=Priestia flexa TaxID=86664 RepID=UPI003D2966D4